MNVNYVDVMGDNVLLDIGDYFYSPERYYYFSIGFSKSAWSQVKDLGMLTPDILQMAGEVISFALFSSYEEKCEKYNQAKKFSRNLNENKKEILWSIVEAVADFSNKYSHAVVQGQNRHWAWEMEGQITAEIVTMLFAPTLVFVCECLFGFLTDAAAMPEFSHKIHPLFTPVPADWA